MEDKSRIWGISDVKAFLISIITGFILLTIVAVIFTEISNETVNKTADRVLGVLPGAVLCRLRPGSVLVGVLHVRRTHSLRKYS